MLTAIGANVEENFQSLVSNRSGIGEVRYLETEFKGKLPVGEIKFSNEELLQKTGLDPKQTYTRGDLAAYLAVKEAIADAQLSPEDLQETILISSTTVGGMDLSEQFYKNNHEDLQGGNIAEVSKHDCGEIASFLAQEFGINGGTFTISTACSSAANACMLGARLIKSGQAKRVIFGGVDMLSRFTLNGFNALYITDSELCKPFSGNRKGLNLGEAAAYLILESEEVISSKKVYAELVGYANSNDAYHQTASSPDGNGAYQAIQDALAIAKISPEKIDYVNVHGTATQNNDSSESKALSRTFGENVPPYSSTKAFTGHTLAAAGGVEAIFSVLSLTRNVIFPNLNYQEPMEDFPILPVLTKIENVELNYILSNSFGFGGNCSSLIFKKA